MRIAVLSDIHSNYHALERILDHAQQSGIDRYWLLGDLIGYGPHPVECIRWFKDNYERIDWVMGNHDAMLLALTLREQNKQKTEKDSRIRQENVFAFKELAEVEGISERKEQTVRTNGAIPALLLNKKALETDADIDKFWQSTFGRGHYGPKKILKDNIEYWLVHASCREGLQIGEYIYPWTSHLLKLEFQALQSINERTQQNKDSITSHLLALFQKKSPACHFHGHSHVPYIITQDEQVENGNKGSICVEPGHPYPLGKTITLANPGSVGQPRNGDQRACYALLDTNQRVLTFHRIKYNYKKTSLDMKKLGYSSDLTERLDRASYPTDYPPTPDWIECMESLAKQGAME